MQEVRQSCKWEVRCGKNNKLYAFGNLPQIQKNHELLLIKPVRDSDDSSNADPAVHYPLNGAWPRRVKVNLDAVDPNESGSSNVTRIMRSLRSIQISTAAVQEEKGAANGRAGGEPRRLSPDGRKLQPEL